MKIPIENIYYLLCYAWNKLDEKDRVKVDANDCNELVNLFSKILINATKIILKRGLDCSYTEVTTEIAGIKGKLELNLTLKNRNYINQKTICSFDEFSHNTKINQILFSTICNLTKTVNVDVSLKKELIILQQRFKDISKIAITSRLFKTIRLHRNNKFYSFVLDVCELVHDCLLLTEKSGNYFFQDFTQDEKKMNKLFEAFIRNFYKLEQRRFTTVRSETIKWQFTPAVVENIIYVPQMQTDITLENADNKIIIDAKYYKETLKTHYSIEKVSSSNLYQIFSYLMQQENGTSKSINATGILLYPTITKEYDLVYAYNSHSIQVRTVNLNSNWQSIAERLKQIIDV